MISDIEYNAFKAEIDRLHESGLFPYAPSEIYTPHKTPLLEIYHVNWASSHNTYELKVRVRENQLEAFNELLQRFNILDNPLNVVNTIQEQVVNLTKIFRVEFKVEVRR